MPLKSTITRSCVKSNGLTVFTGSKQSVLKNILVFLLCNMVFCQHLTDLVKQPWKKESKGMSVHLSIQWKINIKLCYAFLCCFACVYFGGIYWTCYTKFCLCTCLSKDVPLNVAVSDFKYMLYFFSFFVCPTIGFIVSFCLR